jgi:hypothetical protein
MTYKISFPGKSAAEAGVLAQELRLALLRAGADPGKVEIVKERTDTMDLGSVVELAFGALPVASLEGFHNILTAAECALILYEICQKARSGILIRTPREEFKLGEEELSTGPLESIFSKANGDEHGG